MTQSPQIDSNIRIGLCTGSDIILQSSVTNPVNLPVARKEGNQWVLPLTQLGLASCTKKKRAVSEQLPVGGRTTALTDGVFVSSAEQAIRLVAVLQTG